MKKLLVVINYQKDFVDGTLGFKKAETLEDGIYKKVKEYLAAGHKVLFTYDTHFENYLETREGKNLPVPHCYINTEGHELYGKLKEFVEVPNTLHCNKNAFGIAPKDMLKIASELGDDIDEIEFIGVVTNMCVISNVITFQSQYINTNLSVDGTLCASFDDSLHDKALDVIEALSVKVIR
ncbi:cysteine hydrolase family protein [Clostridium saccharoperbutylacetonicum]|uniref:cysteine hydrolase family protein n=1 Tax=Clostridium saccharoperbutylacetonicum TaxID=36745 RepID=UPI0039EA1E7E